MACTAGVVEAMWYNKETGNFVGFLDEIDEFVQYEVKLQLLQVLHLLVR